MAPIPVVLQPHQQLPRVDPPVPATYSHLTRNPGQRRRENKKNRPDLGRTSFLSPNPLQSDQESITDDLEDNFSTTDIIPSPTPIIAPPLLPITTIPHSATTSPSNSPKKLPTEPTPTDIIPINLPPTTNNKINKSQKYTTTRRATKSIIQPTRRSKRTPKPNRYYNSAGCLVISSNEML